MNILFVLENDFAKEGHVVSTDIKTSVGEDVYIFGSLHTIYRIRHVYDPNFRLYRFEHIQLPINLIAYLE